MNIQRVVAGDRLRRVRLVVAQRTHAGVGPDDIVRERSFKVRVIDVQQVVDLVVVDRHRFRIAFILNVGGADDGELIHPRDHKHNAFIFVLQDVGLFLGMHARHHDVAAFDQADAVRRAQMHPFVEELFDPRAGGVDQTARFQVNFSPVSISSASTIHRPFSRFAEMARVRVRTSPPFGQPSARWPAPDAHRRPSSRNIRNRARFQV
jgi:hypothetical protein